MILINRLGKNFTVFTVNCIGICFLILSGCASSTSSESISTSAQTNQIDTPLVIKQTDIEILNGVADPCRYQKPEFDFKSDSDSKLYELINAGYPKEISLDTAVTVFNRFAQCDERSKVQPPLTVDELVAAIRDWDCTEEKDTINKKVCADIWKIAETGKMPKGSFIDSDGSVNRVYTVHDFNGYLIKTYEIYLYIWLDKYRRDMKDEPVYSHKVRLKYISSEKK